jgi:hypothetical protein
LKQDDENERKATKGVETSCQASKPIGDSDDDLGYLGESLDDRSFIVWLEESCDDA